MSSSITSQPLNNNIAMSLYDIDKFKSIKLACLAVEIIGGSRPGHCWEKFWSVVLIALRGNSAVT